MGGGNEEKMRKAMNEREQQETGRKYVKNAAVKSEIKHLRKYSRHFQLDWFYSEQKWSS